MAEYHLHAKTHSRGAGKGAGGHVRYILREGAYAQKTVEQVNGAVVERVRVSREEEVAYAESGHLPAWAQTPADYWDAADQYERANGTVYREIEFALPKELSDTENIALARAFAERLADVPGGVTPYTLAIHRSEKDSVLLHCHLMLSDKVQDGIERDAALWFRRAANPGKDPARGGAPKTQARIGQDWLGDMVRPLWERLANDALAHAEVDARIDCRSLEARRIEQEALAERALAAGDMEGHLAALGRSIALDRPPEPKKGRVLTHAGAEKATNRAGLVIQYAQARAERQEAAMEAAEAYVKVLVLAEEQRRAQAVLERAQLRQGYRMDRWEIRERWSWRQQQREMEREAEREMAQAEAKRKALEAEAERDVPALAQDQSSDAVRPAYDRQRWLEWRHGVLSIRYDQAFTAKMEDIGLYCRWREDYGGLHLIDRRGGAGVVDTGPLLKIPPPLHENAPLRYTGADLDLMVSTAKAKGWKTLVVTGGEDFCLAFGKKALEAGLRLEDVELVHRIEAAQREQERKALNRAQPEKPRTRSRGMEL